MISGDDAIIAEAKRAIGDLEGAVVKEALSFHSANTLTPEAARELIEESARKGVARRASIAPYRLQGPITLEVSFKNYRQAEMLAYLPIVERIDSHSIRFVGADVVAVSKFVQFMNGYGTDLTP
jgi:D-amino peptidase